RLGKRLQLNERGRQILPQAIELLDRAAELQAQLAGDVAIGSLRIGATLTIGNYLANLLIGQYMYRNPGSRVALEVRNTEQVVDKVAHFNLDFGLIEGDSTHRDVEVIPWIADELVIFSAPDHPLAGKTGIRLE